MGGSSYDSKSYTAAVDSLRSAGTDFIRSKTAAATGDYKIHEILNPRKFKNGIRESCFAPGFQDALPIVVGIDATGSMGEVPGIVQKDLATFIDLLMEQGITDHPNVMFQCFDDEIYMPPDGCFQMSQFEIEAAKLVESLNTMLITGGGGGNNGEAYHICFYALANHTRIECFERDQEKGFFFLICDEQPYYDAQDPTKHGMKPAVAKEIFGDTIQGEIPMLESVRKTAERYHIFILRPHHTSHGKDMRISKQWRDLLEKAGENPQNVIEVPDTKALVTTMVMAVARLKGADADEIVDVLRTKGAAGIDGATNATSQIVPYAGTSTLAVGSVSGNLDLSEAGRERD